MIIDKLEYASRYYGLNSNLDYVLKYLVEHEKELKESPIGITRFTENIQGMCITYICCHRKMWGKRKIYC